MTLTRASDAAIRLRISTAPADAAWDRFVGSQPNGSHTQSGLWAQLKAAHGWRITRLVMERAGQIVGGAQLLSRTPAHLPFQVGFISKGPVVSQEETEHWPRVWEAVENVASRNRIWLLRVQLPAGAEPQLDWLDRHGYVPSRVSVAPISTLALDLSQSEESLFAGMSSSVRRNVRHAVRKGVAVRDGGPEDLPAFHRLLCETGGRHGFSPYGPDYFTTLWRVMAAGGHAKMLVAEYEGRRLAINLLIAFGDSVFYKFGASSAEHRELKAANLLQWDCIRWAKTQGYRRYDFEGIDRDVAVRLLQGDALPPPNTARLGVTFYKLGFGGRAECHPLPYEKGYGPLKPVVASPAFSTLAGWKPLIAWVRQG